MLALLLAVLTLTMLTAAAFAADATEAGAYYIRTEAGYTLTVEDAASDGGFYKGASKFKLSCENLPGPVFAGLPDQYGHGTDHHGRSDRNQSVLYRSEGCFNDDRVRTGSQANDCGCL